MNIISRIISEFTGQRPSGPAGAKPNPSLAALAETPKPLTGWHEAEVVLQMGGTGWTLRDAFESQLVIGAMGSAKTSTTARLLALQYLRMRMGFLVLCFKRQEREAWLQYAKKTGREADVVLFGTDPRYTFNFLNYESQRPGSGAGLTENLVEMFDQLSTVGNSEVQGGKGDDPFFSEAKLQLIRHTIKTLQLAQVPLTLDAMVEIVLSAPRSLSDLAESSTDWRERSKCWQTLTLAAQKCQEAGNEDNLADAAVNRQFWLESYPILPEKTRQSIVKMFEVSADIFRMGELRKLFTTTTTLTPDDIIRDGKIVIIDLPVAEKGKVGRMAAILWKYCLQKAIQRRSDGLTDRNAARPVVIFADEFQNFVVKYDRPYQGIARENRGINVFVTQNMDSIISSIGGEANGESTATALLDAINTVFFHANSSVKVNQWAADKMGKDRIRLNSSSSNQGMNISHEVSYSSGTSYSSSEHFEYLLQPSVFSTLRTGGVEHDRWVDAIVLKTGKIWPATGRSYAKITYRQDPWE